MTEAHFFLCALALCAVLGVALALINWASSRPKPLELELVLVEQLGRCDRIVTVRRGDAEPFQVRGAWSAWHYYPTGEVCSLELSDEIAKLMLRWDWAIERLKAGSQVGQ